MTISETSDINMKKVLDATGPKLKPLKCPLCENIYKDQEWLSHHLRTIHKGDMPHRNETPAYNFIEASVEVLKDKDLNNDSLTTDSLGRKIITEKVYPKTQKTWGEYSTERSIIVPGLPQKFNNSSPIRSLPNFAQKLKHCQNNQYSVLYVRVIVFMKIKSG